MNESYPKLTILLLAFWLSCQFAKAANKNEPTAATPTLHLIRSPEKTALDKYTSKIPEKIIKHLDPELGKLGKTPTLTLRIDKDGKISSVLILSSSGDDGVDKAFLDGIKNVPPFGHLPKVLQPEIEIEFRTSCLSLNDGFYVPFGQTQIRYIQPKF